MAAAFMRDSAQDRIQVFSGGTDPADALNPTVIEAMAEKGIDISSETPRRWGEEAISQADVVVSMGCGDACPVVPGKRYVDWDVPDPAGLPLHEVRPIRDDIKRRVEGLLGQVLSAANDPQPAA